MRHYFSWMLLAAALVTGCSQEDVTTDTMTDGKDGVTMTVKDFEVDGATRTSLELSATGALEFKWTAGDKVGVFGEGTTADTKTTYQQAGLTMISGGESKKATFESNSFILKKGGSYIAYYPVVNDLYAEPKISVSYEGQTQTGNDNTKHLATYDYIVSDKVTPDADNNAHFQFSHTGAILRLKIEMPEAGTWRSVTLSTTDEAFTTAATLDLFGGTLINPTTTSSSVTLNLSGVETTEANEVLTAWFMLSPADFTSRSMTVTVKSANGGEDVVYQLSPNRKFEANKAYSYTLKSGVQYIDLGLPSGTLWADRNLGAKKMTDYGLYLPWGESTEVTASNYGSYKGYWIYSNIGKYVDRYRRLERTHFG